MAANGALVPDTKRSLLRSMPWAALGLVALAAACTAASAAIVAISDHQEVSAWRVQPTVLLAALSGVCGFALNTALPTGIAISWFRCAQRGATLQTLHCIAQRGAGRSFLPSLILGFDTVKIVILVALITVSNIGNNPLLQRATRVDSTEVMRNDTLKFDMAQRIPDGFGGVIEDGPSFSIIGSRPGLTVAQSWFWNRTMTTSAADGYICDGSCSGVVRGAGIRIYNCSSSQTTLDMSTPANNGATVFMINTSIVESPMAVPSILLTVLYSSAVSEACIATITIDTCRVEAAVVEYPVVIQNTTVYLDQAKLLANMSILSTYSSPGDLHTAPAGAAAGPLNSLRNFIGGYLNATIFETVLNGSSPLSSGVKAIYGGVGILVADMFFNAEASSYGNYSFKHCGLTWSSPTDFVLRSMHAFMFRAAMRVGNGSADGQQVLGIARTTQALLFRSDYRFLGTALAVATAAIAASVALLWGFWDLEYEVTLSPIEVAKVFRAPLLGSVPWNLTAEEMVKRVGGEHVQYSFGHGLEKSPLLADAEHARNKKEMAAQHDQFESTTQGNQDGDEEAQESGQPLDDPQIYGTAESIVPVLPKQPPL